MLHHWSSALDNGKSAHVLFIDFAKAFDHCTVLHKLCNYGILKFIIDWLASFLTHRQERVKIANVCLDSVTLRGGMPQGSWLGPLIFLIVIDIVTSIYLLISMLMTPLYLKLCPERDQPAADSY